jgi:hypothetical protein
VTIFGGRLTHGMRANLSVKLFESSQLRRIEGRIRTSATFGL